MFLRVSFWESTVQSVPGDHHMSMCRQLQCRYPGCKGDWWLIELGLGPFMALLRVYTCLCIRVQSWWGLEDPLGFGELNLGQPHSSQVLSRCFITLGPSRRCYRNFNVRRKCFWNLWLSMRSFLWIWDTWGGSWNVYDIEDISEGESRVNDCREIMDILLVYFYDSLTQIIHVPQNTVGRMIELSSHVPHLSMLFVVLWIIFAVVTYHKPCIKP